MELKPLFVFPKWSNKLTLGLLLFLQTLPLYVGVLVAYGLDPVTLDVGYMPKQPIPYSHALHAGQLGIDCRYCHNTVEKAGFAAIPPTETCMNCHRAIRPDSDKLAALRESYRTGLPIPWIKIHDLPDFVYFNHAAHVNAAVSCVECHGNVNHMEQVYQVKPLNMAWCLQCHRDPESRIRPRDQVTNLDWKPSADDPSTVVAFASLPDEDLYRRFNKISGFNSPNSHGIAFTPEEDKEYMDFLSSQMVAYSMANSAALATIPSGTTMPYPPSVQKAGKLWIAKKYVSKLTETESIESVKTELGKILLGQYHINPSVDCVTCHR